MKVSNNSDNRKDDGIQPDRGRRSFFCKAGVAVSSLFATSRLHAVENSRPDVDKFANQLQLMKDIEAIRKLQQTYNRQLNTKHFDSIIELFTKDARVQLNDGSSIGKLQDPSLIYRYYFRDEEEPEGWLVHRKILNRDSDHDNISVATDRKSATARFHCLLLVSESLRGESSLIEMAHLQGQASRPRWEAGVFDYAFINEYGNWKIKQLIYASSWQAELGIGYHRL